MLPFFVVVRIALDIALLHKEMSEAVSKKAMSVAVEDALREVQDPVARQTLRNQLIRNMGKVANVGLGDLGVVFFFSYFRCSISSRDTWKRSKVL